jgi:hypothetical protein
VIVAAPAVAGDFGVVGVVVAIVVGVVVEGDADYGLGFGEERSDILPPRGVHPGEVGLVAVVKPSLQIGGWLVVPVRQAGNADFVEIEFGEFLLELRSGGKHRGCGTLRWVWVGDLDETDDSGSL